MRQKVFLNEISLIHEYIYIHFDIYIYIYIYIYTYIYHSIFTYIHVYFCIYIDIYITCIHVHIHILTYIYVSGWWSCEPATLGYLLTVTHTHLTVSWRVKLLRLRDRYCVNSHGLKRANRHRLHESSSTIGIQKISARFHPQVNP